MQKKYPAFSKRRQPIKFFYVRYADDWLFITNADLNKTIAARLRQFKELFSQWISDNLKLILSPEKTLITNLNKKSAARLRQFFRISINLYQK